MRVYARFAELYARGGYSDFSGRVARLFPRVLKRLGVKPRSILDVACGEGTFAVAMAAKGFTVTGVDQSSEMLRWARRQAQRRGVRARFIRKDMRDLDFSGEFDVATCWYDSLNYLLQERELQRTFEGVRGALKEGGIFVFDMNTEYTLSARWQEDPETVEVDSPVAFVVHRSSWDRRTRIATLRVVGFRKRAGAWTRIDEIHRERAYSLSRIRGCLRRAGLTELECWGSLRAMTPPRRGTVKYWIVARR